MELWDQIHPDKFWESIAEGKLHPNQIIDVREREEWEYYHLEGSKLMPLSSFEETWGEVSSEEPVYVICAHGVRSQAVCRFLHEKGYGRLTNVIGGMAAVSWHDGFQYD